MVALFRDIRTKAVSRTFLDSEARKVDPKADCSTA
jgi:hypothetical protein